MARAASGTPIVLALRKPILDPQVVPLDIACLRQAESDCRSVGGSCCLQERAKKSDHRLGRLLRARRKRPRRCRAAEQRDELPAVAVGTPVTGRPPRGSVRAAFPHTALTSGHDGKRLPYALQRL